MNSRMNLVRAYKNNSKGPKFLKKKKKKKTLAEKRISTLFLGYVLK